MEPGRFVKAQATSSAPCPPKSVATVLLHLQRRLQLPDTVFLTFDDGPSLTFTPRVLSALNRIHAKATFFVVGRRLQLPQALSLIRRVIAEGHAVGNHTFNHRDLTTCSAEEIEIELSRTAELLSIVGIRTRLFRPPYGRMNRTVQMVAARLGYAPIKWDNDPCDWSPSSHPSRWVERAITGVRNRNARLILCHDIHKKTADNLERLLQRLLVAGYRFATLEEAEGIVDSRSPERPSIWPIL
jgi:peptidoglycan-N-acetylglucosamine deacetylase